MSHTMNHELLQAVTTGNRDLFEQVIGSNVIVTEAPLTGVTAEGNSVLHIAASHGFLELVEAICRVDGTLIRARNNYFDTPLICAARAGHDNVVAHFIRLAAAEHEANEALLGARNSDGASAMHEAVSNGHFAVLETLLLEEAWLGSTVNARGVSPLYLAVLSGRADMVQLLIEQSPEVVRSPAYYSGPDGKTALHAAALVSEDMTESLRLSMPMLTRRGDDFGNTALHYATSAGRIRVVNLLLEDPTLAYLPNSYGQYPVHIAAIKGHVHIVDQFFELYPNCGELLDNNGRNALHCAIEHGRMKVVTNICKSPSFTQMMNTRDKQGNTPLHLAIKLGYASMAFPLMLDARVSLNATNNEGLTPLDVAIYKRDQWCTLSTFNPRIITMISCLEWRGANSRPWCLPERQSEQLDMRETENILSSLYSNLSQNLLTISVLIAAASFAAFFTVPGGYIAEGEDAGVPVLSEVPAFMSFMEFNALALGFSISATMLLLLTSLPDSSQRYRRYNIRYSIALVETGILAMVSTVVYVVRLTPLPAGDWYEFLHLKGDLHFFLRSMIIMFILIANKRSLWWPLRYARLIYSQFGLEGLFAALLGHRPVRLLKQLRSIYPWQNIFGILSSIVIYALIIIPVSQMDTGLPWQSSHNWNV
ncbi:hypothetical protein OsI_20047 [Oryza sativa Indica Group]|uniref:PGG domain-containing protein n=1 Tax=Oryza sativa subsp. indica TaxID=39946 RepID=A2Y4W9_ORYSI|nr:hypothetical protein OsI_20047 [Oryza sativa Indica Group]